MRKGRRANDRAIKIENLWKRYGLKAVIRELNIEITEGKIVGLVGDNGSGKTTLLKMIAGLQHPSEGVLQSLVKGRIRNERNRFVYV